VTQPLAFTSRLHTSFDWIDPDRVTRIWIACGALLVAFLIVLTPAFFIDTRTVDGVNTWSKPIKFAASLSLHAFTLALLAQLLERSARTGWIMSITAYTGVGATLFEQVYITLQAARARQSHFNYDTEIESLMYALMGVGAVLLTLPALVLGGLIWLRAGRGTPALRLGAVLGLIGGGVLTAVTAGYMSATGSHWVGQDVSNPAGLPIFGWSTEAGDLRVSHFVATHMMQTLPILGLVIDRFRIPNGTAIVWIAAILQAVLAVAVFGQALLGAPLVAIG